MTRTHATALALVNWRGVFYERYLLDPRVTALEGTNGAGKTTVMIACFVVLLPDLARLRFVNVGEGTASGGDRGIWGRLGPSGRPAYAVLEFTLAGGEQILAGVHLQKKGEPEVEATCFLVTGLKTGGSLQSVLLLNRRGQDEVPELPELQENVARLGGQLRIRSLQEYFADLFDHGVTPLRLVADEDRRKLNDMLRTSMSGGISRQLTSGLRTFLLREDTGLAGTLRRMRANLDACRRTRMEVIESRRLEQEISSIYQAGEGMFARAAMASRERCEEMRHRVAAARQKHDSAFERVTALVRELDELSKRHELLKKRLGECEGDHAQATTHLAQVERGHSLASEIEDVLGKLSTATTAAMVAKGLLEAAEDAVRLRKIDHDVALDACKEAAKGLFDLNEGLDGLRRRAEAHRAVVRRLDEARRLLQDSTIDETQAESRLSELDHELATVDAERTRLDRDISAAAIRRDEHRAALRLLEQLSPLTENVHPYDLARSILAALFALEAIGRDVEDLRRKHEEAERQVPPQLAARDAAATLGLTFEPGRGSVAVRSEHVAAQRAADLAAEEVRRTSAIVEECSRRVTTLEAALNALRAHLETWSRVDVLASEVEAEVAFTIRSQPALASSRVEVSTRLQKALQDSSALETRRDALLTEAMELETTGGVYPAELLRLRDELDGELVASRFEDLDPSVAGWTEAALGRLAAAIVVHDAPAVAQQLAVRPSVDEVMLIDAEGALDLPQQDQEQSPDVAVVVQETAAIRVTRLPKHPTLGRRARARRVAELRAAADRLDPDREALNARIRHLQTLLEHLDTVVASVTILEAGDPSATIAEGERDLAEAEEALDEARKAKRLAEASAATRRSHLDQVGALLPDARLLDPPDYVELVGDLDTRYRAATAARRRLGEVGKARDELAVTLEALRTAPPSVEEVAAWSRRRDDLGARRDELFSGVDALTFVSEHRVALGWTDAQELLSTQEALAPKLQEQATHAQQAYDTAAAALTETQQAAQKAGSAWNKADGDRAALDSAQKRLQGELDAIGLHDVSDAAVVLARGNVKRLRAELDATEVEEREVGDLHVRRGEALSNLQVEVEGLATDLRTQEAEARPAEERWQRLQDRANESGVLRAVLTDRYALELHGKGTVNLWPMAKSQYDYLAALLRAARGGEDVLALADETFAAGETQSAEQYLTIWLAVREWIRRRIPAQIANVDDPVESLHRLRDRLKTLEERLARHEGDLRSASEGIANGIQVHIRRAKAQVNRLNRGLEGVRFGAIDRIEVHVERVDAMDRVLTALSEGTAQQLLFQPNLSIEDALDQVLTKYGGSEGASGKKILDYREYIELHVRMRRRNSPQWEPANTSRLSTGEAIGVGASLMMVVLAEWEQDASLLRGRRASGSLRFLFLDEATRLSPDSLSVLFDLCENLELQLLIAAPEVAHVKGATTYHLVREIEEDGEDVKVSGRRVRVQS